MKKFVVLYHAPAEALASMESVSPEEKEAGMKLWFDWKDKVGDGLVDFGNPLMPGLRVLPNGTTENSTKEVAGYSILQAADMDAAKALLDGHPHLSWTDGCDIELHEAIEM